MYVAAAPMFSLLLFSSWPFSMCDVVFFAWDLSIIQLDLVDLVYGNDVSGDGGKKKEITSDDFLMSCFTPRLFLPLN